MPPRLPSSQVGDSPRVRLAHLALHAALSVTGVQGADAGPGRLCVTGDPPGETLLGVSVIAQSGCRYSIDLCLVAGIVPLIELAAEVRRRVKTRVVREGLGDQLGDVNVQFTEVLSAAEIAARAAAQAAAEEGAVAGAEPVAPAPSLRAEEPLP